MELRSPRLMLRPLQPEDATQRYADWLNDSEVNQYLETRYTPQSVESCANFIAQCNASTSEKLFGIFLRDCGTHVGNAKLGLINFTHQRGQLSLFIGEKQYWKQGLAKEVIRTMTRHGFDDLGLTRIEAGCYEENLGSLRAFLSVGYTVEGFFRRHFVAATGERIGCFWMGILKDEFQHR